MRHTPSRLIVKTLAWSIASCAVTLALSLPTRLQAGDEDRKAPRAAFAQPTFKGDGFEASAFWIPNATPKPGEPICVGLILVNQTDETIKAEALVQISARPTPSKMSRVPSIPREIDKQSVAVTLAPRERKEVRVESKARRPQDGSLFVNIGDGKTFVSSISLATAAK